MTTVTVRVPAKINLQLAAGPLRQDGYHDLVTVFHAISLYDEISVSHADADSVRSAVRAPRRSRPTRTTSRCGPSRPCGRRPGAGTPGRPARPGPQEYRTATQASSPE